MAVGAGIRGAVQIERGLAEVVTLTGQTGAAAAATMAELTEGVRGLSDEIGIAQTELVPALYDAISAGVPQDNVFEFMEVAGQAAIAGVTEVGTAVDGLTTTINAFGLEVDDAQAVADSMFAAVRGGKTTFEELSDALFNVAPAAAAAGVTFEEVNAAIATLTASGTPTSVATTQIRAALVGLQRPSEEMNAIFQDLGHETAEVAIREEGLAFALDAVRDASDGSAGKLQTLLGSTEAVAAANVLAGTGAETFREQLDAQADSAGATADAFEVMNQTVGRQFDELKTRLMNIATGIGQAILPPLNRVLDRVIDGFGTLSDAWDIFTAELSGNRAEARVQRATGEMTGIGEVAVTLAGVYERVRDRITTAVDAVKAWWDENGPAIIERVREVAESVVTWWTETAQPRIVGFGEELQRFWDETASDVLEQLQQAWTDNKDTLGEAWDSISRILNELGTLVGIIFTDAEQDVQDGTVGMSEDLGTLADSIATIADALADALEWFNRNIETWRTIAGPIQFVTEQVNRLMFPFLRFREVLQDIRDLMPGGKTSWKGVVPSGSSSRGSFAATPMAEGGIVFDPMLAIVGDNVPRAGEAVVPLDKLPAIMRQAMSGLGSGGPMVGTMNVYGTSPERTARQTVRELRDRIYIGGFAPQGAF